MSSFWYRNAVIYSLDVETFADSNGDGVGDFPGLTERLDYLLDLGVTCLWLQPFYPTPNRDDGYDVADYYSIDPRLGSLADFSAFMGEATRRGLHVLTDLVVNHTSSDHPWFQSARADRDSPYRDYYIWIDEPPEEERRGGLIFPGEQLSNWGYAPETDSYYWHWFYEHQPDLNTGNAAVRDEIKKIMGFWLDLGVSGFRVDAAPFLFKRKGLRGTHPEDPTAFLMELREHLSRERPDAIFLAEADVETDELTFFFGQGKRMQLLLNFVLNNYFFLALASESAEALRAALASLPDRPPPCQWANFLRNHDELNLSRLSDADRDRVLARFAPDPDARIYGRGIRRRLAPMLDGDGRHQRMVLSLLSALPGAVVLRYGEEIGMGDDLSLPGRLSVRTPMQWTDGPGAGFSSAAPERLVRPVIDSGPFAASRINVADQSRDPSSLLTFVRQVFHIRRECPEFGDGEYEVLDGGDPAVLVHIAGHEGRLILAIHNLASDPRVARLALGRFGHRVWRDLLGDRTYEPLTGATTAVRLEPFGFRWLRG